MENNRAAKVMTLIGVACLALSVGVLAKTSARSPKADEMRDAVASPVSPMSPAMLGGARVISENQGYFASPSNRRAEAEKTLMSSRLDKVSKAMYARAAKLRRERTLAVTAQ